MVALGSATILTAQIAVPHASSSTVAANPTLPGVPLHA
jgi:hypothetical protein